jgi:hypothetical protein
MGGPPAYTFAAFSIHTQQLMLLFRHHVIKNLFAAANPVAYRNWAP